MTVKLANLTAQFANSALAYVGIGLNVIDAGSAPESKIMNLSVNANNRFSIDKKGTVAINGNNASDNVALFTISEDSTQLVKVTTNVAAIYTTNYVKTYAEGYIDIMVGSDEHLSIDLSKASMFGVRTNNAMNSFNTITFTAPKTLHGRDEGYSCSVIFYDDIFRFPRGNIWLDAGVKWSHGIAPPEECYGTTILTFLNQSTEPNVWYGIVSGVNFQYYIE